MNDKVYRIFHPDLTNDNILKSLIFFSVPLMISYLFQQLYNMADTVIVGHYLGEKSLGAIGACIAIYELLVGFGNGFGNGLGIVAARAYGARDFDLLKKVVAGSLVITLGVTALTMIVGQFFIKSLLILLGTPDEILEQAYSYIYLIAIFCGSLFAYNLFSGLLRAIGNSFMPLVFLIIASVLNIFFDVLFITRFKMNVEGTAIATVIAQGLSALLCLIYILMHKPLLIPSISDFKVDLSLYRDLLGQGLSMALMNALVSSGSIILQSSINEFGTMIIAGHICSRKIFAVSIIPMITLGMGCATFVSQNFGAKKFDRIKKGVKISNIFCVIWGVSCTIVIPIIADYLIIKVSGSNNEEVLDYGTKYISFMQPFYAVLGILFVTRNSLQGLNYKILPLISSVIELVGKIIFTVIIIPFVGIWGIIVCEPLIWVAMTIQLVWVYRNKIKQILNIENHKIL